MATVTWTQIRNRIQDDLHLGLTIPNAFFDAAVAGSITSSSYLRHSRFSTSYFSARKAGIFRPTAATSADYWRFAGNLTNSTGLLAHTGANYADTTTTSEIPEIWYWYVRPDDLVIDCVNRALEYLYCPTLFALSHLSTLDGDMQVSTDTNWTDVGTPTTSAKSTTARRTPFGVRSYRLVGDAVNEGTQSATLGITQGRQISAFAIMSADTGTVSFQPYDVTNSAAIGTAVTHSEEEPQLMAFQSQSVPSTCKEFATRLLGTTNPSDFYVDMVWEYKLDNLRINLPSYITENFEVPYIFQGVPAQQNGTGYYDAQSLEFRALTEGDGGDYRLLDNPQDANPNAVLFRDSSYFNWPLFVQVLRPYSDWGTLSAETDTTTCPLHLIAAAAEIELLDSYLIPEYPDVAKWLTLRARAQQALASARKQRVIRPIGKPKPYWAGSQFI